MWVAEIHTEEYYLNMMRAWYFATALAKQPDAALPWLTERAWMSGPTIRPSRKQSKASESHLK